jgi:hypothetical protein
VEPARYSLEDLQRIFPAFQHAPFASAGFNAVMLPFSYADSDQGGDANEAFALDALISNDLDWSPGSYCARHAFFVFKQDRENFERFQHGYDRTAVAAFVRSWNATHAVGGKLIRTREGYQGTLQIFNASGVPILSQSYDTPRSFWDLLGDMDVDAMTAMDVRPPQPLIDFLHQPRCKHFQSVANLGSAAAMEARSPQEFAVYQKILIDDPDFAMVRHWYANQKHWMDGDFGAWQIQNGTALASRLEPACFDEFQPPFCPDQSLTLQYPKWLDQAETLVTADSPIVLTHRLKLKLYGGHTHADLVDRAAKVAAVYPNSHDLLTAMCVEQKDPSATASILVASLLDRYMPGSGSKEDETYALAVSCDQLARDDIAVEVLRGLGPEASTRSLELLLQLLCRDLQYKEAADLYSQIGKDNGEDAADRQRMAPWAFFAAFMSDRPKLMDQVLAQEKTALAADDLTDVFQNYRTSYDTGRYDLPLDLRSPGRAFFQTMMYADIDGMSGTSSCHDLIFELLCSWPTSRYLWIAEDRYEKYDPSDDAAAFYDYLETFYSHDPWVKKAVAGFRARGGVGKPVDPALLRTDLQQFINAGQFSVNFGNVKWKRMPTPWRIAACVHQLLQQNKAADAAEIARLYVDLESEENDPIQMSIACELLRKAGGDQSN